MANAKIQVTVPGLSSAGGLTLSLFTHPGAADAAAVASGLALTVDAADTDTYWTEVNAASLLSGIYRVKVLEGATDQGSGYVKITNTTNVHVVCESPNLADIDGTTAVIKWGAITDRTATVELPSTTIGAVTAIVSLAAGALSAIATAVWGYASRRLTMTAAQIAAAMAGDKIVIRRSTTFEWSVPGVGSLAGRTNLWLTIKTTQDDDDDDAIVQLEEGTGLVVLAGSSDVTAADGSLVVDDEDAGDFTFTIEDAATAELAARTQLYCDLKMKDASGTHIKFESRADVTNVVTQRRS